MTVAAGPSRPKVVVTRKLPTDLLAERAQRGEIDLVVWPEAEKAADRKWLLSNAKGAQGLVVMLSDKVDEELIEAAGPSLKAISTMSVGYDHIALKLVKERGIRLGYTPGVLNGAVAELTLLLVLGVTRQVPHATRIVREGLWPQTPWSPLAFSGPSLEGKTVGFLGFGSIAQTTALSLLPFGPARVCYTASSPRPFDIKDAYFGDLKVGLWEEQVALRVKMGKAPTAVENVDIDRLARESDVLIVLASLSPATKHIVNADFLAKMKPTSYLVNVARGPLVDTSALHTALSEGRLAGAGLDVLEGEPAITQDHPLVSAEGSVRDRVFLMPHVGSATTETRLEMSAMAESSVLGGIGLRGRRGTGEMEHEV
ncbi:unnamed protein product [Parajaminaea phylloscopi]